MIDTETLKHLPDEYKDRLVNFEQMFRTKGFEQLKQYAEAEANERRDRMLSVSSWEQYIYLRAEWAIWQELANLEEITYREFETLAAEAQEQKFEEVELEYE